MLTRYLQYRKLDQIYRRLVWSENPNAPPISKSKPKPLDINMFQFIPNDVSEQFLQEASLIKSYLLKRELEFPKLKRFHKPFVYPQNCHLKFECFTNLKDTHSPENSNCILTFKPSDVVKTKEDEHILAILSDNRITRANEIRIEGNLYPYYKQNMRWCFDKYKQLLQALQEIKDNNVQHDFINLQLPSNEKQEKQHLKEKAKEFPAQWMQLVDPKIVQDLKDMDKQQVN